MNSSGRGSVASRLVGTFFPRIVCALVLGGGLASGASALDRSDPWLDESSSTRPIDPDTAAGAMAQRSMRHRAVLQSGVPLEYRNLRSPYPAALNVVRDGGALYTAHCATCHAADGFGDGEGGLDLSPPPALLAFMVDQPSAVDEYLLWSVAEGGAAFGSEMPAFKDTLGAREIWRIITYMRAGFPPIDAGN